MRPLIILLLATCLFRFESSAQLPNFDFEQWYSPTNGVPHPSTWLPDAPGDPDYLSRSQDAIEGLYSVNLHTKTFGIHGWTWSRLYSRLVTPGIPTTKIYMYIKVDTILNQQNHLDVGAYIRIRYKDSLGSLPIWSDTLIRQVIPQWTLFEFTGPALLATDSIEVYFGAEVGANQSPIVNNYASFFVDAISFNTPITPNSIDITELEKQITIFPNPSNDKVYIINKKGVNIISGELYNLQGKRVRVYEQSDYSILDVSKLPNGNYFLLLHSSTGVLRKRITLN